MAAKDPENSTRNEGPSFIWDAYLFSYGSALARVNLWKENGINFESGT